MWVSEVSERLWQNHYTGWALWAIFLLLCAYWAIWHIPATGYSVAVLAVAAALMSAQDLRGFAKFCWVLLLFGLLFVEMRAIDKDKHDSTQMLTQAFKDISTQANTNLRQILTDEHNSFAGILQNQQTNFLKAQQGQVRQFGELLATQEALFNREEQMAAFLNGQLLPAAEPTPSTNGCPQLQKDDVGVFLGTDAFIANRFPHTILQVKGRNVVTVDRVASGSLVLSVEMRDTANRIIARLDKNGFIVNPNYLLYLLRPDKSTIIIDDEYGDEILNAHYLNSQAFRVSGFLQYQDRKVRLELPFMRESCTYHMANDITVP